LGGGVIAAVIGPNLANYTRENFYEVPFAGSYISLLGLYFLAILVLSFLKLPAHKKQ